MKQTFSVKSAIVTAILAVALIIGGGVYLRVAKGQAAGSRKALSPAKTKLIRDADAQILNLQNVKQGVLAAEAADAGFTQWHLDVTADAITIVEGPDPKAASAAGGQ